MSAKINDIEIKNRQYRKLKVQHIRKIQDIYRTGQYCDVKFVTIDEPDLNHPIYAQEITSTKYALKTISKQKIQQKADDFKRQYDRIYNQIFSLYLIDHPNIIKIYWHYQDQNNVYILTEYGGTKLIAYITKNELTEEKIKYIFKQICQGVQEIYFKNIMHRDLNLSNILISSQNDQIKIIDFGFAHQYINGRDTLIGTLQTMAPQVYHKQRYNHKADVWSLGIILYQLFHKRNPFIDDDTDLIPEQLCQKRDKLQYEIDESLMMSLQAKNLIQQMLCLSPEKRPSIQKVLKSKWLNDKPESSSSQDSFSHFVKKQDERQQSLNDNRKTKHNILAKQKKQSRSSGTSNFQKQSLNPFDNSMRQSDKDDNFFFNKLINKLTTNASVHQLQNKLKQLIQIRTQEIYKKKDLLKKVIQAEKKKLEAL